VELSRVRRQASMRVETWGSEQRHFLRLQKTAKPLSPVSLGFWGNKLTTDASQRSSHRTKMVMQKDGGVGGDAGSRFPKLVCPATDYGDVVGRPSPSFRTRNQEGAFHPKNSTCCATHSQRVNTTYLKSRNGMRLSRDALRSTRLT
jgi:hypothetical protein